MSSANNDLTQSLLVECRRKDELIEAYKEKITALENLDTVKNEYIKFLNESVEKYKGLLKESQGHSDAAIKIAEEIIDNSKILAIKSILK